MLPYSIQLRMKKTVIVLVLSGLFACHGNESAENKPTDLDRTKNRDTSIIKKDSILDRKDSMDTTRH